MRDSPRGRVGRCDDSEHWPMPLPRVQFYNTRHGLGSIIAAGSMGVEPAKATRRCAIQPRLC